MRPAALKAALRRPRVSEARPGEVNGACASLIDDPALARVEATG